MRAAIYARKSTEQSGMIDEEKSVTRQIDHAKAYATKKGWTVADEHVFVDDGISGAEFVKRPGLSRLLNALRPKPPFQVLVMSEESRLGREQIQTAYALQQITDAGVRVWLYLSDQERKLDSAMDKIMSSLAGFAAEMEREKASQRTHDAMLRKAKALYVWLRQRADLWRGAEPGWIQEAAACRAADQPNTGHDCSTHLRIARVRLRARQHRQDAQ
jgi:DNA invertase Pin-like site-specific DNA recombinase